MNIRYKFETMQIFVTDTKFRFVLYSKSNSVKDIWTSFITHYQSILGILLYAQRRFI